MTMENQVMKMRSVERLSIRVRRNRAPAAGRGYHVMLLDLKSPLKKSRACRSC